VKFSYLNEKSSHVDESWYTNTELELDNSHVTKYKKKKIQDGERPPFFDHNSAALVKFRFQLNFARGSRIAR